jgi:hypothetical protein
MVLAPMGAAGAGAGAGAAGAPLSGWVDPPLQALATTATVSNTTRTRTGLSIQLSGEYENEVAELRSYRGWPIDRYAEAWLLASCMDGRYGCGLLESARDLVQ